MDENINEEIAKKSALMKLIMIWGRLKQPVLSLNKFSLKRKFQYWKWLIDHLYFKLCTFTRSLAIKNLVEMKHLHLKHLYFKKFWLKSTSKKVISIRDIEKPHIDQNIISNQAMYTVILDKEEKALDTRISLMNYFLFEQLPWDPIKKAKASTDKKSHSQLNSIKFNTIVKYSVLRKYHQVQVAFKKWINLDWKETTSFAVLIDEYKGTAEEVANAENAYYLKKTQYKHTVNDYVNTCKNSCSTCLNTLITKDVDFLSINEENSDPINDNLANLNDQFQNMQINKGEYDSNMSETKKISEFPVISNFNEVKQTSSNPGDEIKYKTELIEQRIDSLNQVFEQQASKIEDLTSEKYKMISYLHEAGIKTN